MATAMTRLEEGAVKVLVVPGDPGESAEARRVCREWADLLDIAVTTCTPRSEAELAAALRHAAAYDAVVVSPGPAAASPGLAEAVAAVTVPVVIVRPEPDPVLLPADAHADLAVVGRGDNGYKWALRHLHAAAAWPVRTLPYGQGPDRVGDLRLPQGSGPHPMVVLLHGGFWREPFRRDMLAPLAVDLAQRGYATWNLEYRRVGASGGGWPATLLDVAAGLDAVAGLPAPLDPSRVAVLGHSAGGQLALWAAGRHRLPPDAPGASPAVRPRLAVPLAGACDLALAAELDLGDGAAVAFLGATPRDEAWRYAVASPRALLPLGVPQVVVHGDADDRIPVGSSRDYVHAARRAGDDVTFLDLPRVDHVELIDP